MRGAEAVISPLQSRSDRRMDEVISDPSGRFSMTEISRHFRPNSFFVRIALPALAAFALVAGALAAVTLVSADQANRLAGDRQEMLVRARIDELGARIGYEQESITVWNESMEQASAARPDLVWFDDNLGIWLHDYYGHDEAYVLRPDGQPIYAMRDGKRAEPADYHRLAGVASVQIRSLHARMAMKPRADVAPPQRVVGVSELAAVGGHPAIVSIKPITLDGGAMRPIDLTPVHISVRRLDGDFAASLAQEFRLQDASYERSLGEDDPRRSIALTDRSGDTLGYLAWRPFEPGGHMLDRVAPFAGFAFLLLLAIVMWLLRRINRALLAQNASEAQARHLAFHDALTGLPNSARFKDHLVQAFADRDRTASPVALLHLKIDGLRQIDDVFGQAAGDALVRAVAGRLAASTRTSDFVARIGGDEFAIIQSDSGAAETEILCLRVVEDFAEPFFLGGQTVNVGVAIGAAFAPPHAVSGAELGRKAKVALHHAQMTTGTRYVLFDDAMDEGIRERLEIENDLREALSHPDAFEIFYQPLFDATSRQIVGAEALLRWHHPARGTISPAMFIPVAEACGAISQLGLMVLRRACEDAVRLGLPSVSVNVSAVQLRDPQFAAQALAIVAQAGLPPAQLEIEITETTLMEDERACQKTLAVLRARGVRIALDDFGTGYSSFSYLRRFDIDRIKIDRSFVSALGAGRRRGGRAIVRAMIDLAKASGLKVTAEGVEREAQQRILAHLGCDTLQGFYLSEPVAPPEFARLLGRIELREASA